jgi:23S rRNA (guanosine2251-2'-O)-methyltransferase
VEEAFVARRPAIRLLVVPQRRMALEKVVLHATSLRIPIVEVEGGTLTSLAGFDGHQGVALVVGPRRYATVEEVIDRARDRGEPPFVLALDSLEDPQNVGTLLRSAEAVGVHGVLFPTHRQAPLSPAAVKASAGAVEHLLLVPVDDLPGALADLHVRGLRVAGADGDAPLAARQADLRGPIALVVGSEGQGLGPAVRRRTDFLVRIPMRGNVGSLNAAVAGSVLLFEVLAQRDPAGELTTRAARPAAAELSPEPSGRLELIEKGEPAEVADRAEQAETALPPEAEPAVAPAPSEAGPVEALVPKPKRRTTRRPASPPAEPEAVAAPVADAGAAPVPDAGSAPAADAGSALEPAKPKRARRAKTAPGDDAESDLLPGGPLPKPTAQEPR